MGLGEAPQDAGLGDTLLASDASSVSASTGSAASAPESAVETEQLLARAEQLAGVVRLRKSLAVGSVLWPGFLSIDWLMAEYVHPQPFVRFLIVRAIVWIALLSAVWRLRRQPVPSESVVRLLDTLCFGGAALAVAVMCIWFGGVSSAYAGGIPVVMVCRGAFVTEHWRRSIVVVIGMAATYPVVVLGSAMVSARIAAQLRDPAQLVLFGLFFALILATLAFTLLGGHAVWALRRQVFESRGIGRYRLKKRIGKGGMGEVWVAHHGGLKRDVAMKILRPERRNDPAMVRRFEREVHATTELTHPNTVRLFDYGVTDDGVWYYAMELLAGEDLARFVAREGPLAPPRAVRLLRQACDALAEAHARGIVHRDVKPENVFVSVAGRDNEFIKILDFGIAKVTMAEPLPTLTHTGWVGGTPAYLSPEVARGDEADARSDVYALGAVLYFALTGGPPFAGANAGALLNAHIAQQPVPPSVRLGRALPPELEAIVMRCLEKDAGSRYADAGELAVALAQSLEGQAYDVQSPHP